MLSSRLLSPLLAAVSLLAASPASSLPDMDDRDAVLEDVRRMQSFCRPLSGQVPNASSCVNYCQDAIRDLGKASAPAFASAINKNSWGRCRAWYLKVPGAAEDARAAEARFDAPAPAMPAATASDAAADELDRRGIAGAQPILSTPDYNLYLVKSIRGQQVDVAAIHRQRGEDEPIVGLVPAQSDFPESYNYSPQWRREYEENIRPAVKRVAPMVRRVRIDHYVRGFHRTAQSRSSANRQLPLLSTIFDDFESGALMPGTNQPRPAIILGRNREYNSIRAARAADIRSGQVQAARTEEIRQERASRPPSTAPTPEAQLLENMGLNDDMIAIAAAMDRHDRARTDPSGVTYRDDKSRVKLCNGGADVLRVASLRANCPLTMFFDSRPQQCTTSLSGWEEIQPSQCRGLVIGLKFDVALAIYGLEKGQWQPKRYHDHHREWSELTNAEPGAVHTVLEVFCGRRNEDFSRQNQEVRVGRAALPCAPGDQALFFNGYVRAGEHGNRLIVR